jgi:hypothetical protein
MRFEVDRMKSLRNESIATTDAVCQQDRGCFDHHHSVVARKTRLDFSLLSRQRSGAARILPVPLLLSLVTALFSLQKELSDPNCMAISIVTVLFHKLMFCRFDIPPFRHFAVSMFRVFPCCSTAFASQQKGLGKVQC